MTTRTAIAVVSVAAVVAAGGCSSSGKSSAPTRTPPTTTPAGKSVLAPTRPPNAVVARPVVTGPVTGGAPDIPTNAMLASYKSRYGYNETEFFMQGTATSYRARGTPRADGKWAVVPGAKASYKTRLLARTPSDPKKFNGTVIVEWLNTTSGRDADPDFGFAGAEFLRAGFAYVAVTAQSVGLYGGFKIDIPGYNPTGLRDQNPARYGSLHHPGDEYSYDIFSQVAQAILHPRGPRPLGSLVPRYLIATGQSQSGSRLVTYVNAIAPLTNIYDGFMIHSRGDDGSPLNAIDARGPRVAHIRTDLRVPVMMLSTETDLFELGFDRAIQPDSDLIRTWQMAGTAHADQSTLDYGISSGRQWDKISVVPDFVALCGSINDGPEQYIERAAFVALNAWVVDGKQPPHAPPIKVVGDAIARDAHGIAIGGIRTPAVDVPTESLSGESPRTRSLICSLFGTRAPFPSSTLKQLYPSHADYVADVKASSAAAVKAGFLLPPDAREIDRRAQAAPVPT